MGDDEQIASPFAAVSVDDAFADGLRNGLRFDVVIVDNIGDVGLFFEPFLRGGLHFVEV